MTAVYSSPAFIPPHLHEESDRDDTLILISGAFHNTALKVIEVKLCTVLSRAKEERSRK